jgi:hypothetical protein
MVLTETSLRPDWADQILPVKILKMNVVITVVPLIPSSLLPMIGRHCIVAWSGETYEVHWPHSAVGAYEYCGPVPNSLLRWRFSATFPLPLS